jgi:hypothetical protein
MHLRPACLDWLEFIGSWHLFDFVSFLGGFPPENLPYYGCQLFRDTLGKAWPMHAQVRLTLA